MNQDKRLQSIGLLVLFIGVITVLLVISFSTLSHPGPQAALPVQSTSTPILTATFMPTPYFSTDKVSGHATWMATTRTPFPTQPPVITGTREGEMVIFSAQKAGLVGLNGWGGYLDGNSVVVYAGSRLEDPQQGAIVVFYNLPSHIDNEQTAWTPTKNGAVKVIAEQNNRLTLQAIDGTLFYFDIPARRFVDSLSEFVPSVTPAPTFTPFSTYGAPVYPPPLSTETSAANP